MLDSISAVCIVVSSCVIAKFIFKDGSKSILRLVVLAVADVVGDSCKLRFFEFFGALNVVMTSFPCVFFFILVGRFFVLVVLLL